LAPSALFAALGIWSLIFAVTRIVSVGSIAASLALPLAVLLSGRSGRSSPVLWAAILTTLLVVVRHRSNLARLLKGQEKRLILRGPSGAKGDRPA
jgi:acyl phosphate:glycerol-3-phosphate acyltransferase